MAISTVEDTIEALGGNAAVAEITSNTINAIYNWRAAGKFPADTYLLLQNELKSRGRIAPDSLWSMRRRRTKRKKAPSPAQRTA